MKLNIGIDWYTCRKCGRITNLFRCLCGQIRSELQAFGGKLSGPAFFNSRGTSWPIGQSGRQRQTAIHFIGQDRSGALLANFASPQPYQSSTGLMREGLNESSSCLQYTRPASHNCSVDCECSTAQS